MSLPAISKHLRVLEKARLLTRRREGRVHHCRLAAGPMKDASVWIDYYRHFWESREAPQREKRKPNSFDPSK